MSTIAELEGKLDNRRAKLHEIFEQAGADMDMSKVSAISGDSAGKAEQIRQMNDEMSDLGEQLKAERGSVESMAAIKAGLEERAKVDRSGRALAALAGQDLGQKDLERPAAGSIGEMFVQSEAYTTRPKSGTMGMSQGATLDVGLSDVQATLFQRSAGWAAPEVQTGLVLPYPTRPMMVADLFPQAATTASSVVYMEETTATNNAAERAEGGAYVESALALTKRTATVETIGTSLPITDEQLEDVAQAKSYVDGRLGFFVMYRLDSQLINGDGSTPNIRGILNASGLQTQAKGADPTPDAIYKGLQKVRGVGAYGNPNASIWNPDDWTDVRLLRTADGVYVWGNPSEAGPDRIWGVQVVQTGAIAAGTAIVGDFSPAMVQLYIRRGLDVQVGYVNDDFKLGKQTVRAGIRVANVIYRGAGFCTVTGV